MLEHVIGVCSCVNLWCIFPKGEEVSTNISRNAAKGDSNFILSATKFGWPDGFLRICTISFDRLFRLGKVRVNDCPAGLEPSQRC